MNVKVEDFGDDCSFAHWDRVLLVVWRGKTTLPAVRRSEQLLQQQASLNGDRLLLLTLVEVAAPLPSLEARAEIVSVLKRAAGKIERSALVYEGEGFRAASVRAVAAGIALFARPVYPYRVFNTVGAAARFLGGADHGSLAPHLMIRAVREARRRSSASAFVPWLPTAAPPTPSLRQR